MRAFRLLIRSSRHPVCSVVVHIGHMQAKRVMPAAFQVTQYRGVSSPSGREPPVLGSSDVPTPGGASDVTYQNNVLSKKIERTATATGFIFSEGSVYEGEVASNMRHGKGRMEFASGVVCDGDWVDDIFNGSGDIHIPQPHQSFYRGGIKYFKKHGYGEFYASLYSYKGNWAEGEMDGYGELSFSNEGYKGHFKAGLKHGEGTYTYANKDVYTGMFEADKRHGYGVQRTAIGGIESFSRSPGGRTQRPQQSPRGADKQHNGSGSRSDSRSRSDCADGRSTEGTVRDAE
eukprot:gene18097-20612_t